MAQALDKAAEVIRRCADATIEVRSFGDEVGGKDALSQRRARAAERYLRLEGVGGRRLVAVGARLDRERRAGAIEFLVR
jgi:OmpA-OmpF porin, OOP family